MTKDCPYIEFNGQSLKIEDRFCYLGDRAGDIGGTVEGVITRIRSG